MRNNQDRGDGCHQDHLCLLQVWEESSSSITIIIIKVFILIFIALTSPSPSVDQQSATGSGCRRDQTSSSLESFV